MAYSQPNTFSPPEYYHPFLTNSNPVQQPNPQPTAYPPTPRPDPTHSLDYGLWFTGNISYTLTAFSDADWGSDVDDRRSTSGYCIYLGANLVSWSSKKQRSVSRSTAEAEYRSLADATSEVTWLESILSDMGVHLSGPPTLWCDNTSAVAMAANSVLHGKTKHVDLDLHFVRERVQSNSIQVRYVPASAQTADVLTKPLTVAFFPSLRRKLNVLSFDDYTA